MSYLHAVEFVALAFVSILLWILTASGLKYWNKNGKLDHGWEYLLWLFVAALAVAATAGALVV